ncbi:MAG: mechanosensitive ion channel [Anaerolineales bacterium]|nr:mechanosensitive ion channel [Anaerolineales bacterium]
MQLVDMIRTFAVQYGLNLLGAILIVLIGWWAARIISRLLRRTLEKARVDLALARFGGSLAYYAILVFAVLAALNRLGVETTSFVAVIGAAGLAIGLALEGALSNFAAGVLLLLFRPFRIGDLVEIADKFGSVEEIMIFNTVLVTRDNKTITIPNSQVTGSPIVNYSKRGVIRLDLVYGIGYDDDLLKAKAVFQAILEENEKVLREPAPSVSVLELADSSVNFAVRPYVHPEDYFSVPLAITEQVKLRLDAAGISIPYPQRDVHLYQTNG